MSIPSKNTNKRSANSLLNGISFQYAAAILVFLKEIKNVKAIGTEDTDDIRIVLKDNSNIFAQAKSALAGDSLYKTSHFTTDIKDSLATLYENRSNDTRKLISIFNFHNPFGKPPKFNDTKYKILSYKELTTEIKNKIKSFCNDDEEMVSKLEFWFLRFEGKENPISDLVSIVEDYITRIDSRNIHASELVKTWVEMLANNGRDKENLINFNLISGSIFNHVLINSLKFDDVYEIIDTFELDFSQINKIEQLFDEKFRNLTSFEEYAQVLSAYTTFKSNNPTLLRDRNSLYRDFAISYNATINPSVLKMFEDDENPNASATTYINVLTVAYAMKSDVIRKIKEVFNYED